MLLFFQISTGFLFVFCIVQYIGGSRILKQRDCLHRLIADYYKSFYQPTKQVLNLMVEADIIIQDFDEHIRGKLDKNI